MYDYFPTDVRVRVKDDRTAAAPLLGAARELLFKALEMHRHQGTHTPVVLQKYYPDGSSVSVFLFRGQKIVSIVPATPVTTPSEFTPEFPVVGSEGALLTALLHGWVRKFAIVTDQNNPKISDLDSYRATPMVQSIQKLPDGFNLNSRLAVGSGTHISQDQQGCRYSGAMKRLVQAIYSIGIFTDTTPGYISGIAPSPAKRGITNPFQFNRDTTHGLYNAGDGQWWIIEVSSANGVLAMPLPIMAATKNSGAHWQKLGDTETKRVTDEFGGFPTGEGMPSGGALTAAIAGGKVLQLLTATDIAPFYNRHPYGVGGQSDPWGWAFNDLGSEAHNTCWILKDVSTGNISTSLGEQPHQTSLRPFGEHWRISIQLSAYDLAAPAKGNPVGTGTATLTTVSSSQLAWNTFDQVWFPDGTGKLIRSPTFLDTRPFLWVNEGGDQNFTSTTINIGTQLVAQIDIGPDGTGHEAFRRLYDTGVRGSTVFVYFNGNNLVRVRFCPGEYLDLGNGSTFWSPPAFVSTDWVDPRVVCSAVFAAPSVARVQFDQTVLFPTLLREGWGTIYHILDDFMPDSSTLVINRDDWYFKGSASMAGVIAFNNPLDSYNITQQDIVNGRGTTTNPPGVGVSFDWNVNAGPSQQFLVSDGAYYTSNKLPFGQVRRVGVPAGLENFRPAEMAFIGSPQG